MRMTHLIFRQIDTGVILASSFEKPDREPTLHTLDPDNSAERRCVPSQVTVGDACYRGVATEMRAQCVGQQVASKPEQLEMSDRPNSQESFGRSSDSQLDAAVAHTSARAREVRVIVPLIIGTFGKPLPRFK